MAEIVFAEDAWEEYLTWQQEDKKILRKINALLKDILRHPFTGQGQPEPLRHDKGNWSRRINGKDRLVYEIASGQVIVKQCKGHYADK